MFVIIQNNVKCMGIFPSLGHWLVDTCDALSGQHALYWVGRSDSNSRATFSPQSAPGCKWNTWKKVSKVVLQTVTMADNLSEGSNIDAEYSSYFEDENSNELEDYDVSQPLSIGQRVSSHMFEEEADVGEFVWFQDAHL